MKMQRSWARVVIGLCCLVSMLGAGSAAADLAARIRFDIGPQELPSALLRYSEQSGVQVTGSADLLEGRTTAGVVGELAARDALEELLKGTQLVYDVIDGNTVAIRGKSSRSATAEEIVVTGSHIRGADSASPLIVFDRQDIENSGFSNTQQFIQSLTQNFGGGFSELTVGALLGDDGSNYNYGRSSGANLRGLGSDSTLTLLNGRRLAPAGIGDSVDLSMIPLSAIERVDVLTDGASAIYGSDAMGGVINIVLRKGYDGAETRVRYGNVTEGSNPEYRVGQTYGADWESGALLATYEFSDRDSLTSDEREATRNAFFRGIPLVPELRRHSGLVSLTQRLSERVTLSVDGMYSERSGHLPYMAGTTRQDTPTEVAQYGVNGSLQVALAGDWRADVGVSYNHGDTYNPSTSNGIVTSVVDMNTTVNAFDAKVDGSLFALPGGVVKLATGAHLRQEEFESIGTIARMPGKADRDVKAVFAEMLVPLIGVDNRHAGVERLELTLAARYEDYSDFGSTTNPKIGLLWSPVRGINIRSTYGTSFRAPSLYESSESAVPVRPFFYIFPDPLSPTGSSPTILLSGSNANLRAEESDSWTAGFDLTPAALPGLSMSVTYFDFQIENRVATPVSQAIGFFDVLIDEENYREYINRNPDLATVQGYYAHPRFLNLSGQPLQPPENVGVVINNQLANVAQVSQSGLDVTLSYLFPTAIGDFDLRLGGTYLLRKKDQLTPNSPQREGLNELRRPVDLKLRNSIGWSRDNLRATVFVNYVDSYRDPRLGFEAPIDSWTTVDLSTQYATGNDAGMLSGLRIGVGVQNVTDEPPPFVDYFGYNFDATNASIVGRYFYIDIAKQFGQRARQLR